MPRELPGNNKLARMMVFSVTHNTVRQKANSPQEVVGGEEWIHHFTPTSKRSTMEWKLSGHHAEMLVRGNQEKTCIFNEGVILFRTNGQLHVAQQFATKVLLANVGPPFIQSDLTPNDFHVSNLEGALSGYSFTCAEDVRCATITWLMQRSYVLSVMGKLSHTTTSSSTVKGTMLRDNAPVTPSLCNVSFLYQTWSQMYGYYKLTL
jgi:hypothetical protein